MNQQPKCPIDLATDLGRILKNLWMEHNVASIKIFGKIYFSSWTLITGKEQTKRFRGGAKKIAL
jgi:hypothetical protein